MFNADVGVGVFFFKQKTAYEIGVRLVGSEMCIRDSYKLLAFVVSAAFAGMAGTLYAMNFSTVTAAKFDFNTSILVLVFVVLGGLGNIWGSIIAAALLTLLPELLRGLSNYRMLIYAILLIAMMLFNNSSLKKRMLEKRGMKQMEKLERAEKSGKEGA